MRSARIVLFPVFLCLFSAMLQANPPLVHKFYVSITTIALSKDNGAFEVTLKCFTDDLELAIERESQTNLKLGSSNESPKAKTLLTKYLNEHFQLEDDTGELPYSFLGWELEADEIFLYAEVPLERDYTTLNIRQSLLTEVFQEQVNIVNIDIRDTKTKLTFDRQKTVKKVHLD